MGTQTSKFEHDEIERRLKDALQFAFEDAVLDDEISVEVDGPFVVLVQYSLETNEPIARFEISFDITDLEVS